MKTSILRRLCTSAIVLCLAISFLSSVARAGVTLYTDRAAFDTAAGATRMIDFSGVPIPPGQYEYYFPYLSLSGECIQSSIARTTVVYNFPTAPITLFVGPNTHAVGTSWFPWYSASVNFTASVSAGGVVSQFVLSNTNGAWQHTFIGFVSDKPIDWVSFSLDNAYLGLDYFVVSASGGSVVSCPVPACTGPAITAAAAATGVLWPPNHKMIPETISVTTSGGCGTVSCQIVSVSSNEPVDDSNGDWTITGPLTVNLRADRLDSGTGRIYTITIQCTDANNNSATKTVTVIVPHDQGK